MTSRRAIQQKCRTEPSNFVVLIWAFRKVTKPHLAPAVPPEGQRCVAWRLHVFLDIPASLELYPLRSAYRPCFPLRVGRCISFDIGRSSQISITKCRGNQVREVVSIRPVYADYGPQRQEVAIPSHSRRIKTGRATAVQKQSVLAPKLIAEETRKLAE